MSSLESGEMKTISRSEFGITKKVKPKFKPETPERKENQRLINRLIEGVRSFMD